MTEKMDDSKLKAGEENVIAVASNVPIVVDIEELKKIDGEVQYAIANHQSYLNPRSKESWLLYGRQLAHYALLFSCFQKRILIAILQ